MNTWLALLSVVCLVEGHGRINEPPGRSTAWRYGFNTPVNYNDIELYCGGFQNQVNNGGKCGVCGDPWQNPQPRENEAGGKYGRGVIVKNYQIGQTIDLEIFLKAYHKGWFEFRMCVNNDVTNIIKHACLDQHLLVLSDGTTRYYPEGSESGTYTYNLKAHLPAGVSCSQCVIQWKYHAGNTWGTDPDGTSCTGCGPQEEFYGCSDVSIGEEPASPPPVVETTTSSVQSPTPVPTSSGPCHAIGEWLGDPNMDKWCNDNCAAGNCPPTHCQCN